MSASGHPHAQAVAAALHNASRNPKSLLHRDDGGMVSSQPSPGIAPSVSNQNPQTQGLLQRFAQMSPEQLHELLPRLNGQIAQIAQRVLQQKNMQPQTSNSTTPAQAMPQYGLSAAPQPIPQPQPIQPQQQARGGASLAPSLHLKPAHLTGAIRMATGGGMQPKDDTVPILAAGGEFVVNPHHVLKLGQGDLKAGHKALDAWVVEARKQIVKKMTSLKGPVKQ
jgi:hypothetical protein